MDMERLTINLNPTANRCVKVSTDLCYKYVNCFDCPQYKKMIDRLAAYEDTGLEPEEITDLMAAHGTGIGQLAEYRAVGTVKHLRELVQAETDGRLVVLPCKVVDTVYMAVGAWNTITGFEEDKCDGFHIARDGILQIKALCWTGNHGTYGIPGNTVFLTREEAEAALGGGAE